MDHETVEEENIDCDNPPIPPGSLHCRTKHGDDYRACEPHLDPLLAGQMYGLGYDELTTMTQ